MPGFSSLISVFLKTDMEICFDPGSCISLIIDMKALVIRDSASARAISSGKPKRSMNLVMAISLSVFIDG